MIDLGSSISKIDLSLLRPDGPARRAVDLPIDKEKLRKEAQRALELNLIDLYRPQCTLRRGAGRFLGCCAAAENVAPDLGFEATVLTHFERGKALFTMPETVHLAGVVEPADATDLKKGLW